jgi:hypothetical protein
VIFTIKDMNRQAGIVSPLVIAVIVLSVLMVGVSGFAFWSFSQYQSYKNDVQPKIDAAVTKAKDEQSKTDQAAFVEQEKIPTRVLVGPNDLGAVQVAYPKTWSAYVDKNGEGNEYEAYLHPSPVPGLNSHTAYALRVTVDNRGYEDSVKDFEGQVKANKLKAVPVTLNGTTGLRLDGSFPNNITGSMVVFKVRDKTLKIYTQSTAFAGDFNNIVLPSLKFNK